MFAETQTRIGLNTNHGINKFIKINSVAARKLFFFYFVIIFFLLQIDMKEASGMKNRTRSSRAGVVLPVGRLHRNLRKGNINIF